VVTFLNTDKKVIKENHSISVYGSKPILIGWEYSILCPNCGYKIEWLYVKAQAHLFNMVFSYDTSNIYICNAIKKETCAYMRIRKAQGREISFNTALIEVVVGRLNHENMHRILYKTINKSAAIFYDRLMGGEATGKGSYSATDYTMESVLP